MAKAFTVASKFMELELGLDLRGHLSSQSWDQLIELREFYDEERKRCENSIGKFKSDIPFVLENAGSLTCHDCFSDLILFLEIDGAVCRSCEQQWDEQELVVAIVSEAGGADHYSSIKDGGDPSVIDCPHCGEFSFIIAESYCVSCDESSETECDNCGDSIPAGEIDGSGRCSHCDHVMSQDD